MENFMPLILDAAVVLIVFTFMKGSARKGFVRTVVQFVGYLAAMVFANIGSKMLAAFAYDGFIRTRLLSFVENSLVNATDSDMIVSELTNAIESLPPLFSGILSSGSAGLPGALPSIINPDMGEIAMQLTDTFFAPMAIMVLRSVFFFLIFAASLFLVKLFAKAFTGLNYIPLIGPVNALLGGAVGILEAFLFLYIFAMILNFVLILTGNSVPFITQESIESTYLFKNFFAGNLPSQIFGGF